MRITQNVNKLSRCVLKSQNVAGVLLLQNNLDTTIELLFSFHETNVVIPLLFLWVFFCLFMMFNVFYSFAAILLITEAAMLTLIMLLTVSIVTYFPNLTADILNLLNASAMEAIIGITTVFIHQKAWKSRYTNSRDTVLESMSWFSTYILLIWFGHVSWGIFRLLTGVTYYWIKSVFKTVVESVKKFYNLSVSLKSLTLSFSTLVLTYVILKLDYAVVNYEKKIVQKNLNIKKSIEHNNHMKKSIKINNLGFVNKSNSQYCSGKKYRIHKISRQQYSRKIKPSLLVLIIKLVVGKKCLYLDKIKKSLKNTIYYLAIITLFLLCWEYFMLNLELNGLVETFGDINIKKIWRISPNAVSKCRHLTVLPKTIISLELKTESNLKFSKNINNSIGVVRLGVQPMGGYVQVRKSQIFNQTASGMHQINPKQTLIDLSNFLGGNLEKIEKKTENEQKLTNKLLTGTIMDLQYPIGYNSIGVRNHITGENIISGTNSILNFKWLRSYGGNSFKLKYLSEVGTDWHLNKLINLGERSTIPHREVYSLLGELSDMWYHKNEKRGFSPILTKKLNIYSKVPLYYESSNELLEYSQFSENKSPKMFWFSGVKEFNNLNQSHKYSIVTFFNDKTNKITNLGNVMQTIKHIVFNLNSIKTRPIGLIAKQNTNLSDFRLENGVYGNKLEFSSLKKQIEWSGKNWQSIFSEYSKLLPWYDEVDLDDEPLDYSEIGSLYDSTTITDSLRLKNKINYVEDFSRLLDSVGSTLSMSEFSNNIGVSVKKLNINGEVLKKLEESYKSMFRVMEGSQILDQVLIGRAQLKFPITSPRAINHLATDQVHNVLGSIFSKGSIETPVRVVGVAKNNAKLNRLELGSYLDRTKTTRLFTYSEMLDLGNFNSQEFIKKLNTFGSNFNIHRQSNYGLKAHRQYRVTSRVGEQISELHPDSILDDVNWSEKRSTEFTRFHTLRAVENGGRNKVLRDGNYLRNKIRYGNRVSDLLKNRKIVENRMILPIRTLMDSRLQILDNRVLHEIKRIPRSGILDFIEKNERNRELESFRRIPNKYKIIPYDQKINIMTADGLNGKLAFEDDLELDVDVLRTSATQPHSLYGLLWDEYLKQSYGMSLQFLDFNQKFRDINTNNNSVVNFKQKEQLALAIEPDYRYRMQINDEIKNTLFTRLIPKVGYLTELENPQDAILNLKNKNKKKILHNLRSKFYHGRGYKKKLKKFIKRELKFAERPQGFKYDQIPHQVKLPYRKKLIWVNNNISLQKNEVNFGYNPFSHLDKKNKTENTLHRYDTVMMLHPEFKNLAKRKKIRNRGVLESDANYTNSGVSGYDNYNFDNFLAGTEVLDQTLSTDRLTDYGVYRVPINKLKTNQSGDSTYILKRTKSGILHKNKGTKLRYRKKIRLYTQYILNPDSIAKTAGTDKYTNSSYFTERIALLNVKNLKNEKKYDNLSDFKTPMVDLLRSGDIGLRLQLDNLELQKLFKYRTLGHWWETPDIMTYLDGNDKNSLSKNFYNGLLTEDSKSEKNFLFDTEYYSDYDMNGITLHSDLTIFGNEEFNPVSEYYGYYNRNDWGFTEDSRISQPDVTSVIDDLQLSLVLQVKNSSGPTDITRSYYTYFSLNPWNLGNGFNRENINLIKFKYDTKQTYLKMVINRKNNNTGTIAVIARELIRIFLGINLVISETFHKFLDWFIWDFSTKYEVNQEVVKYKYNISRWNLSMLCVLYWVVGQLIFNLSYILN